MAKSLEECILAYLYLTSLSCILVNLIIMYRAYFGPTTFILVEWFVVETHCSNSTVCTHLVILFSFKIPSQGLSKSVLNLSLFWYAKCVLDNWKWIWIWCQTLKISRVVYCSAYWTFELNQPNTELTWTWKTFD